MKYFCEAGFAAFHFESQVPAERAVAEVAGRIKLAGNINNPVTLLTGSPTDIRLEVQRAIDAGVDIISPECAVPLQTSVANLMEIVRVCKDNTRTWAGSAEA